MSFGDVIKTVAPWLAAAATGPAGLAGMAVKKLAEVVGATDETVEAVTQAISGATPDQLLALKKADQEFSLQMQALGFKQITDLESIAAGDRKDARDMQKQTRSPVPAILSISVTVGYFGILAGMMTNLLKVSDSQALLLMLGSLSTAWGMVMAFWFGTTRASEVKTELLAKAQPVK